MKQLPPHAGPSSPRGPARSLTDFDRVLRMLEAAGFPTKVHIGGSGEVALKMIEVWNQRDVYLVFEMRTGRFVDIEGGYG